MAASSAPALERSEHPQVRCPAQSLKSHESKACAHTKSLALVIRLLFFRFLSLLLLSLSLHGSCKHRTGSCLGRQAAAGCNPFYYSLEKHGAEVLT